MLNALKRLFVDDPDAGLQSRREELKNKKELKDADERINQVKVDGQLAKAKIKADAEA